ncbi:MAG: transglutaminase domain-containing protein [Anaerolineales bacterium]|nr:transglutaminase domain-containing protein [Anaerolineales bacterium]
MSNTLEDALSYYTVYGIVTNPGVFGGLFENLPPDISQLRRIVQGLLVHVFWAERYGEDLSEERIAEADIRHVERILARIQENNRGPLEQSRNLSERFVGNCRTYSVLMASMLQYHGKPARARCGFGKYFKSGWHEDHWICEYWNENQSRWIMVDAQLDNFQCQELRIGFDPLDVPRDQFIVGGKAWLSCRNGESDPDTFGIFDMHGMWFIRGNLVRDVAALNKVELLPWDGWGLIDREDSNISPEELTLLDDIAAMTSDEVDYAAVREVYETNEGLVVPPIITSYTQSGTLEIELSTEKVVE